MIDYERGKIIMGDMEHPIKAFQVWFKGPTGLLPTFELAMSVFQAFKKLQGDNELDFYMVMKPVCIAVTDTIYEELP